jgi:hypothetical protein
VFTAEIDADTRAYFTDEDPKLQVNFSGIDVFHFEISLGRSAVKKVSDFPGDEKNR